VLGVLPPVRATLGPLVTGIAVIPPIALLPILFIALGLGETAKVALIVVGIAPPMIRDLTDYVASLPREQIIKAQTLGASSWQIMIRVALPQAMPRLIQAVRLALGPAWVFLISAEAIASDTGLGYRIFLVRRYLSMDVIIPYVAWIALLAIVMDLPGAGQPSSLPLGAWSKPLTALHAPRRLGRIRRQDRPRKDQPRCRRRQLRLDRRPSGAGKSSLLRLVLGQEAPTRGTISLDGAVLPPECGPDRGVVFQRYSVFPHLTALQNTMFGLECAQSPLLARLFGRARRAAQEEATAMLEAVGLAMPCISIPRRCRADAAAPGDCPGAAQAPAHPAAGRTVRRARSGHPRRHARADPPPVARACADRDHGHARHSRGLLARHAVLALDKRRHDPHAPHRYGATVVYDLPLRPREDAPPMQDGAQEEQQATPQKVAV
jgi:hypothetical protein